MRRIDLKQTNGLIATQQAFAAVQVLAHAVSALGERVVDGVRRPQRNASGSPRRKWNRK